MNKEEFLFRIKAITREVTCMSESRFEERFKDGIMKFVNFSWGSPTKTLTSISMKKIYLEPQQPTLSDGVDPPAGIIPVKYIDVSPEEYKKLFVDWPNAHTQEQEDG